MISFDIPTIRLCATMIVLATMLSLFSFWRARRFKSDAAWWIAAILVYAFALIGALYPQSDPSDFFRWVVAVALILNGFLFLNAVRIRLDNMPLGRVVWGGAVLLCLALAWFEFVRPEALVVTLLIFLANTCLHFAAAALMLRKVRANMRKPYLVSLLLFTLVGIFNIANFLYFQFVPDFRQIHFPLLLLVSAFLIAMLNHAFILMTYDDVQQNLDKALQQLREESDKKLKSVEERWLLALDYGKSGAWEVDVVTGEALMSEHWARLVGLGNQEIRLPAIKTFDYIHPDDYPVLNAQLCKLEKGEIDYLENEHRLQRSNGSWIWVCSRARKMALPDGGREKLVGIDIDITESRLRQAQLEQAIVTAEQAKEVALQASKAKTTFLTNISHEIRTPMNAILGFSQLLLDDKELSGKHKESLEIITSSGVQLMELIDDILNLSRIQSGHFAIKLEPVKVREFFEDTARYFHKRNVSANVTFHTVISPALPTFLQLDSKALRQICMNLLSNAFKFTQKGSVELQVDYKPGKESGQGTMVVSVTDTGAGIREELKSLIFSRFEQSDRHVFTDEGVGLGLAICKDIVNQLEGRIEVQSKVGVGSKFTLVLPVEAVETAEASTDEAPSVEQVITAPSILIVDDIESNRLLLRRILSGRGYEIEEASSASLALTMMRERRPSLVLMDIRMPVLDGDKAIRLMREDKSLASIPVIAITANVVEGEKERLLEIGANDFISKPFMRDDILVKVASLLPLATVSVPPNLAQDPATRMQSTPDVPKMKMLVVDDNPANQQLLLAQLRTLGLEADSARNGREAINSWYLRRHDIVLTDCAMPLMDGFELTRMIRQAEVDNNIAKPTLIIAVTGSPEEYSERCLDAGMNDLIGKPILIRALTRVLARYMPEFAGKS